MPKRKSATRLDKINQGRNSSMGDSGDWVITCFLGVIVGYAVYHLGGHHPKAELTQSWLLGGLLVLHGVLMMRRPDDSRQIHGTGLLFLPFLCYAGLRTVFQSPMPWRGWEEFLVLCQGWVVFWLALHHLRNRKQVLLLIALVSLSGLMAFLAACYQHVENPQWLPMGRTQKSYFGRASGTFGAPTHFGAFMGLLSTLLLFTAASNRFSSTGRLLCGFAGLIFGAGLVASGSRGGWIGMFAALLCFPYFLSPKWLYRLAGWAVTALMTTVLAVVLYHQVDLVQGRIDQLIENRGEPTRKWMWQTGWDIFMDHPLFGSGTASYQLLFERYRAPEAQISPIYVHNDYLNTLSDLGLLGFLLFFGPCAWILGKGWSAWKRKPFKAVIRRGRRKRSITPFSKMILGGLLVTFVGFSLHLFVDFHLEIPALLFMTALYLGLMVISSSGRRWKGIVLRGPLARALWLALCLTGGGLLALRGTSTFMAATRYLEGEDMRENYLEEFSKYQKDRAFVETMVQRYEEAVRWEPMHGWAWSDLSLVSIQSYYLNPKNSREIGKKATIYAEKAIAISDQQWAPHAYLGIASQLERKPRHEVEKHFQKALYLAPTKVAAWNYYADFLSRESTRSEEAMKAVEQALKLDPTSKNAIVLKKKLLVPKN